jgi:hypothetical protein
MLATKLSAEQSISLFGLWRQPVFTLSWADVKNENFTWKGLRALGLEPKQLQLMQPDKHEWLQRGGVNLQDLKDMTIFPVNPLLDYAVDLAELWAMGCTVDEMQKMNIEYEQLLQKGITPAIMAAFGLTLSAWADLGFKPSHAKCLSNEESNMIFGLQTQEVFQILRDYKCDTHSERNTIE